MPIRLNGSTSGYSQLDAPAIAGDQLFTLPGAGGTLDRINRAGNVLQVVQVFKNDTFSTSSATYVDVTGLSTTITPSSSSNKILVCCYCTGSNTSGYTSAFRVLRDSATDVAVGATAESRTASTNKLYSANQDHSFGWSIMYLDSPSSASSTAYKIQIMVQSGGTAYLNRTFTDNNQSGASNARTASGLVLIEVAA